MAPFLKEYEKLRLIGKGAFSSVYKVRHLQLNYVRAIKVSNELIEDEKDKAWITFVNECKVLLALGNGSHPNIVHVYRPRLIDGRAIVEMDYIEGQTLNRYLSDHRFIAMDEVSRFIRQVVGAMSYCHRDIYRFLMHPAADHLTPDPENGNSYLIDKEKEQELIDKYAVTHNDLHSNNIMRRDYDGGFILLDFGLAIQDGHSVKSSSRNDGAIEYRAPEKWEEEKLTPASDVYSLAVLIFEVLSGRVPFPVDTDRYSLEEAAFRVREAHLKSAPPSIEPLRRQAFESSHPGKKYTRDFPEQLESVIRKGLAKNPADRYSDAKAFLKDLENALCTPIDTPPERNPDNSTATSVIPAKPPVESFQPDTGNTMPPDKTDQTPPVGQTTVTGRTTSHRHTSGGIRLDQAIFNNDQHTSGKVRSCNPRSSGRVADNRFTWPQITSAATMIIASIIGMKGTYTGNASTLPWILVMTILFIGYIGILTAIPARRIGIWTGGATFTAGLALLDILSSGCDPFCIIGATLSSAAYALFWITRYRRE